MILYILMVVLMFGLFSELFKEYMKEREAEYILSHEVRKGTETDAEGGKG